MHRDETFRQALPLDPAHTALLVVDMQRAFVEPGQAMEVPPARDTVWNLVDWACGCVMIYGALFGIGKIILKEAALGSLFLAIAVTAGAFIYWDLSRRGWSTVLE